MSLKESNIKVLVVEPGKQPYVAEIENTLKAEQKLVGGPIQAINYNGLTVICNDEGKLMQLPLNRALKYQGSVYDIVAGTFFVCGTAGEEFCSISDTELEAAKALFQMPEKFTRVNGLVYAVPYDPENK